MRCLAGWFVLPLATSCGRVGVELAPNYGDGNADGYCQVHNTPSTCTSGMEMACKPSAPLSSSDATADGVDDDCDGQTDEDACVPRIDTYSFRSAVYAFSPPTGCTKATVKLWGGAGATGSDDGGVWGVGVTGGAGGAGGCAQSVLTVDATSMIQLYVGQGGQGCAAGTTSNASYKGGAGGASNGQAGSPGADGIRHGWRRRKWRRQSR